MIFGLQNFRPSKFSVVIPQFCGHNFFCAKNRKEIFFKNFSSLQLQIINLQYFSFFFNPPQQSIFFFFLLELYPYIFFTFSRKPHLSLSYMTVIFLAVSYITKNYTRSLHTAVCPIHSNNSLLVIPSSIISLHLVPLVFPLLILHLFQARSLAIISSSSCLIVCYHLRRIAEKGFFLFMTLHLFSLYDIGQE